MTEFVLCITIISLIVLNAWTLHRTHELQRKLVKALLAKDLQEYTTSEIAEERVKADFVPDEEVVPMQELSDTDFQKAIQKQLNAEE